MKLSAHFLKTSIFQNVWIDSKKSNKWVFLITSVINSWLTKNYSYAAYLDLTKGFCISQNLLLKMFYNNHEFAINSIALLRSHLEDREQFIWHSQHCSNKQLGKYRVAQGSVLNSVLFLVFYFSLIAVCTAVV